MPERQKLTARGVWKGTLKNDMVLSELSIKEKQLIGLVGQNSEVAQPSSAVVFLNFMAFLVSHIIVCRLLTETIHGVN
jgi:hypothetical protein